LNSIHEEAVTPSERTMSEVFYSSNGGSDEGDSEYFGFGKENDDDQETTLMIEETRDR
jgi:hypothetical protein